MRLPALALVLAACGSPKHAEPPPPAPVANAAPVIDAAPPADAAEVIEPDADDGTTAGAVPLPDTVTLPLEQIDTTVTDAELAAIKSWPAAKRNKHGGEVWIALDTIDNNVLELAVVEDNQGVTARYPIGTALPVSTNDTFDGDTYPARDHSGDYTGPILFAIRVMPPGATTHDQVAVFITGSTLRVARRRLGAPAWKPVLSIAFASGATFRGIGTTDPH